jgi:hypothetical protein
LCNALSTAGTDKLSDAINTLFVTRHTGQASRSGPSAIAVHNHSNMLRRIGGLRNDLG